VLLCNPEGTGEVSACRARIGGLGMTEPAAGDGEPRRRGRARRQRRSGRLPATQAPGPSEVQPAGGGGANPFRAVGGSDDPHFNAVLMRQLLGIVWIPAGDPSYGTQHRLSAATSAVLAFKPKDEVEAMLAAQTVALHFGAMEALRRSMLPDQPGDAGSRLRKDAANLSRAMAEMMEALARRQGKGRQQVVRVERVVVQEGGQAIVGAVSPAPGPARPGGEGRSDS
jgi:hypothetical protein